MITLYPVDFRPSITGSRQLSRMLSFWCEGAKRIKSPDAIVGSVEQVLISPSINP